MLKSIILMTILMSSNAYSTTLQFEENHIANNTVERDESNSDILNSNSINNPNSWLRKNIYLSQTIGMNVDELDCLGAFKIS